jgi:hypothetical protein
MDLSRQYSSDEMKYYLARIRDEMEIHDVHLYHFPTAVDDPDWKAFYRLLTSLDSEDWLFLHRTKYELGN